MRSGVLLVCAGVVLCGCAGPFLNGYTDYLGPTIGTIEEKQVLQNLGNYLNNPWAIPGHVELANGQIQATNQLGINLKYPYSQVTGASTATNILTTSTTRGSEVDLNPAQTQDQESYNLLPVTDPDDLRRLRAIYHYAICPNRDDFLRDWEIADQFIFQPPPAPPKPKPKPKAPPQNSAEDAVRSVLSDFKNGKITSKNQIEDSLPGRVTKENKPQIDDILDNFIDSKITADDASKSIVKALGQNLFQPYAAPAPTKTGGKNDTTKSTTGSDSIKYEQQKAELILDDYYGLGSQRWLYWRDASGNISGNCPGYPSEPPPDPENVVRLGTYAGHTFYTDNLRRFSDLVLFVLGGIPNTTGTHVLDGGGAAPAINSKAGRQQFFSLGGQLGTVFPLK